MLLSSKVDFWTEAQRKPRFESSFRPTWTTENGPSKNTRSFYRTMQPCPMFRMSLLIWGSSRLATALANRIILEFICDGSDDNFTLDKSKPHGFPWGWKNTSNPPAKWFFEARSLGSTVHHAAILDLGCQASIDQSIDQHTRKRVGKYFIGCISLLYCAISNMHKSCVLFRIRGGWSKASKQKPKRAVESHFVIISVYEYSAACQRREIWRVLLTPRPRQTNPSQWCYCFCLHPPKSRHSN